MPVFVEFLCTFPVTLFKRHMLIDVNKIKILCPTGSNGDKTMVYFGPDDYVVAEMTFQEVKDKINEVTNAEKKEN